MKVEVADRKNMYSMCVATIVDVIGDRLRLRYDGLEPDVAEDFWCHYQSSEIHPIGWSSLVGHTLQPPIGKKYLTQVHRVSVCVNSHCTVTSQLERGNDVFSYTARHWHGHGVLTLAQCTVLAAVRFS